MTISDVTVVPVAGEARAAYVAFSRRMAEVYRDHGAIRVTDHWQTDGATDQHDFHATGVNYEPGRLVGLPHAVGATDSESVVVTVIEWPSRDARDRGTAAATADPRVVATLDEEPVFDGARLLAATFEVTLDLHAGG